MRARTAPPILLPAANFLEYDDIDYGLGHTHIIVGMAVLERNAECRTKHELTCALAKLPGCDHRGFALSARELLDVTLRAYGIGADRVPEWRQRLPRHRRVAAPRLSASRPC